MALEIIIIVAAASVLSSVGAVPPAGSGGGGDWDSRASASGSRCITHAAAATSSRESAVATGPLLMAYTAATLAAEGASTSRKRAVAMAAAVEAAAPLVDLRLPPPFAAGAGSVTGASTAVAAGGASSCRLPLPFWLADLVERRLPPRLAAAVLSACSPAPPETSPWSVAPTPPASFVLVGKGGEEPSPTPPSLPPAVRVSPGATTPPEAVPSLAEPRLFTTRTLSLVSVPATTVEAAREGGGPAEWPSWAPSARTAGATTDEPPPTAWPRPPPPSLRTSCTVGSSSPPRMSAASSESRRAPLVQLPPSLLLLAEPGSRTDTSEGHGGRSELKQVKYRVYPAASHANEPKGKHGNTFGTNPNQSKNW